MYQLQLLHAAGHTAITPRGPTRRRTAQQEIKQVKAPEPKPEPPKTDAPK